MATDGFDRRSRLFDRMLRIQQHCQRLSHVIRTPATQLTLKTILEFEEDRWPQRLHGPQGISRFGGFRQDELKPRQVALNDTNDGDRRGPLVLAPGIRSINRRLVTVPDGKGKSVKGKCRAVTYAGDRVIQRYLRVVSGVNREFLELGTAHGAIGAEARNEEGNRLGRNRNVPCRKTCRESCDRAPACRRRNTPPPPRYWIFQKAAVVSISDRGRWPAILSMRRRFHVPGSPQCGWLAHPSHREPG